jgi:hypothetical protein
MSAVAFSIVRMSNEGAVAVVEIYSTTSLSRDFMIKISYAVDIINVVEAAPR